MSLAVAISGSTVTVKIGSFKIEDRINMRSICDFTVEDSTGTARYTNGMPVTATDSVNGLLFAGFIDQPDEHNLYPNAWNEIDIQCKDMHYLADKRRPTLDYSNMQAGDIVTDMLSRYLSAEGVTSGYAYRRDTTNTDFAAGTLTGTTATLNVGDGDLELSKQGTDVTKTFTSNSDFTTGASLTNVDAGVSGQTANQLNLHAYNAIKFSASCTFSAGNAFAYWRIYTDGGIGINANDELDYDVWISSTSPAIQAAVDIVFTDGTTLRDVSSQAAVDQNGIHAHPGSDLTGFANDQWYHRTIVMPAAVNSKTVQFVTLAFEGDSTGEYQAYFRNIFLKDSGGATRRAWYDSSTHPYDPSNAPLNANGPVSVNGYNVVVATPVTVYDQTGTWISPAVSIDAAKIVKDSLVSWTSLIPTGVLPATAVSGSSNPLTPDGTTLTVYTSIDNKATWQACSFKSGIPSLLSGFYVSGRNLYVKAGFAITTTTPEQSAILADVTTTITSSWVGTKTDFIATKSTTSDWNTGTYTNTITQVYGGAGDGDVTLNGFQQNWNDTSILVNQTLFGAATPKHANIKHQCLLTSNTGNDVRSRIDSSNSSFLNFTAQVAVTIMTDGSGVNSGMGLVYRTTNWANANNSFGWCAYLTETGVFLGIGANGGAPAWTQKGTAAITLTAGQVYTLKVIVNGNSHQVYVDDVLYINISDATYNANTSALALRMYNNTGSTVTGTFDDFGVYASLTGTWQSADLLPFNGFVGNQILFWENNPLSAGATILCEVSNNGGGAWAPQTNGGTVAPSANGHLLVRFTLTAPNAISTPVLHGFTVWYTNNTSASGTRVSPVLSLNPVGRAGSTSIQWDANLNGGTLGVDMSPDASSWTDVSAYNGQPLPSSYIYIQPNPWIDFFSGSSSTQGNGVTIGLNPGCGNAGSNYAFWTNLFADLLALGVTWVRFQLSWCSIELTQGVYSFSVLDAAVQAANAAGINFFYTIRGAPTWALDPANGAQLATSEPFYIMSASMTAGFATVLMQRYYPGSPHGHIDKIGWNEDFSIHHTSVTDTLTLNQTVNPAGAPYTSFAITSSGFTPKAGTKIYFGTYSSTDIATVSTDVLAGDTLIHCNSFTPTGSYTASQVLHIGYVGAYSGSPFTGLYGSGNAVTTSNKTEPARDFHFAISVYTAVYNAIRALNTSIPIGLPVIWWTQPVNGGIPNTATSSYTASMQTLYTAGVPMDAYTFIDFHYYSNGVDPTVGGAQCSTIGQAMTDLQTVATANGDAGRAIVCSEYGWQANQTTTSSTTIAAGTRTITLASTRGAAVGGTCLIDSIGSGVQETVTITGKTTTTITAVFANAHTASYPVVINLDCAATGADGQDERYGEVLATIGPGVNGNMAFFFTLDYTQNVNSGTGSSLVLWNGSSYDKQPAYTTLQTYNTGLNADAAAYTQTNLNGGAATWTWDTINARLLATQTTSVRGVLKYPTFSRKDMFAEADFNYSDSGGLVVRMVDTNNAYYLVVKDASSGSNPNTVQIKKIVAGTVSNVSTLNSISFTRGDYKRFRLDIQGTALNAYMDNVLVATGTDSSISSAGAAGILCGVNNGDQIQCYSLRIQPYGDDQTGLNIYTRLRLATTLPTATPQVLDLTISVHNPSIGNGVLVPSTAFAYTQNLAQSLDTLASMCPTPTQYIWYLDKNKKPYFNQQRALAAPWYVWPGADGRMLWSANPVVVSRPDMLYRNRQIVDGGIDTTSTITYTLPTDGITQTWQMAYPLNAAPIITLDDVTQNIGVAGVDTGKDFYYQIGSATISQDPSETPPAKTSLGIISYIGQIPVRVVRNNTGQFPGTVSQAQLAAIDKTSGIVEDYISDPTLTKAAAEALGDGLLQKFGVLGRNLTYSTNKFGLAPGQLALHAISQHGVVNAPFLITKVTTTASLVGMNTGNPFVIDNMLYWYAIEATEGPVVGDWTALFGKMLTGGS